MKEILMVAAMTLTLGVQQTGLQQTGQQKAGTPLPSAPAPQQSAIPDAPKPQTAGVTSTAPGKGTTQTNNGQESTSAVPGDDQDAPSALPGNKPQVAADADSAPIVPETGHYTDIYKLPALRVNYVEIPFTVKDKKGQLVPGIESREVRVYENDVRQKMAVFTVDPFPLSVALVIDQSMDYQTMGRVNSSLGALSTAFAPYDEVAVFTYNNGVKMQDDFTAGTSARLAAVIERAKTGGRENAFYGGGPLSRGIDINDGQQDHVNPLTSGGPGSPQGVGTPRPESHTLNDAILAAAKATTKAQRGRRRIVYVISDGKEYGSVAKTKEVIKYLQQNKVQVYATLVGDSSVMGLGFVSHLHLPMMVKDNILNQYTAATGGEYYAEYRSKGIETSFAKIAAEERNQYTVGYVTREPFIDGKYRKVDVRILRPNLEIIAKSGYYPSAQDAQPPTMKPMTGNVAPPAGNTP